MEIRRDIYLDKLISKKHNRLIKVITGIRRCGKSVFDSLHFVGVGRTSNDDSNLNRKTNETKQTIFHFETPFAS